MKPRRPRRPGPRGKRPPYLTLVTSPDPGAPPVVVPEEPNAVPSDPVPEETPTVSPEHSADEYDVTPELTPK